MKTAISIPDPIFQAAETLANRLGISRSELYAKAVASFIEQVKNKDVTAQLDQVYSDINNSLAEEDSSLQFSSLDREEWP